MLLQPSSVAVRVRRLLLALTLAALPAAPVLTAQQTDSGSVFSPIKWRNIGPFRGGRSVAATGVRGQPDLYYAGYTGGGVWKTEDRGLTWHNITDGQLKTGSVGTITVAPSDPNVIYIGMGEHAVRGVTTSAGDGVYRSTDAGKTWTHLGLEKTQVISSIQVHPGNPDLAYVAAQGNTHGPNPERGIYRTRDGGESWTLIHSVSDSAGASDLSMDPHNPRILYAGFWQHVRLPWQVRSGGAGSGLWKSTDGGDSWQQLDKGLPKVMGKTAIAVSPVDGNTVWAMIEAEDGGLFRSDDAGATWRLTTANRLIRARAWYYIEVMPDTRDRETVYVLNAPLTRSIDGGKTFGSLRIPHGDTHGLWINPDDSRLMILADDGGATITGNAGQTWSSQENQPTAQFYRVNTDHRFPYWVYGGQQDNNSVATPSASFNAPGIGWKDWFDAAGCESAYLAFDRDDPRYLYGGCYQGIIAEMDTRNGGQRDIMAYPTQGLASIPSEQKYRFNWNAPIVVSDHDPSVIYHGANRLLRSTDRGNTWTAISPDLTRDEKAKQGPGGGPITNEGAGGEVYNTIFYIAESPRQAGLIWVGTDDGLIHLTRNGGSTWENVTPKGLPESLINSIEASPHDPAVAYAAVSRYKFNDPTPHLYRTADYGKSWTRLVNGIGAGAWVRVVREDPVRKG
ncbi:MAG: glycosyl hydrolase, partial [Gemmatimonadota bacterium]